MGKRSKRKDAADAVKIENNAGIVEDAEAIDTASTASTVEVVEMADVASVALSEVKDRREKKSADSEQPEKEENEKKGKKKAKKKSIQRVLINVAVLPVVILGVILTISNLRTLRNNLETQVTETLDIAATSLYNTYSLIEPGDYWMNGDRLYKGGISLNDRYEIVDALKQSYHLDLMLFYKDTGMLTTIKDENGVRQTGYKADDETVHWVLESNRKFFTKNLTIGNQSFYGYFVPMINRNGDVVGMAFAGRDTREVQQAWLAAMLKSVIISVLAMLITLLFCITLNRQITTSLTSIQKYLGGLAGGNFDMKMPLNVRRRSDEIGDMGRYAIEVCKELEKKITTDPLTGLLNRRACNLRLQKLLDLCNRDKAARATVTIGDIDHFKRVNDTYGHECGDVVLKKVSQILKEEMKDGIVARWGGEEFLVVLPVNADDMIPRLDETLKKIRNSIFEYEDFEPFNVTMTFGVNGSVRNKTMDDVIKEADRCLYDGKETGRNRIVTVDGNIYLPDGSVTTIENERAKLE